MVVMSLSMAATAHKKEKTCFELPIVVVSPINDRLPRADCNQRRLPAPDCMKRPVEANVEEIDHAVVDDQGNVQRMNCLDDDRTDVFKSKVHYRGSSSLRFGKHQMTVKMHKEEKFLGFPSDRSFVLNGPYVDASLMRNHLAHWLFRQTGRYSPRSRHAVLFIRDSRDMSDETPHYKGIYLALEHISYGPNRVALARLDSTCRPDQINGGWAWQFNPLRYGVYSPNVLMDDYQNLFGNGERPVLTYPPARSLTQSMRDYFVDPQTGPLPQLYRYLYHNMTDPNALEDHVELGSFVDYFLHTEMSQNQDGYRRSAYFFKDRDQPINAGPVWDFNLAYGIGAYPRPEGWIYTPFLFWKRLMCNYKFVGLVAKRWRALRASAWSDATIESFIMKSAAPIKRQLQKCRDWRSGNLQCAHLSPEKTGSFDDAVILLTKAVLNRMKWMDENIAAFYRRLDGSICGPGGSLPAYNCASNTSDAGCLQDPEAYIDAVTFPPLREPYGEAPCEPQSNSMSAFEKPDIDPCWFSTGFYVTASYLTPFCSGYGECNAGPGAKCRCHAGHHPPTCARNDSSITLAIDSFDDESDARASSTSLLATMLQWGFFTCSVIASAFWVRTYFSRRGYRRI